MRYKTRTIKSISSLITRLEKDIPVIEPHVWFRGQADKTWNLVPSLGRGGNRVSFEQYLIKRFRQNATLILDHQPRTDWEWLLIMQHHRAPTRLLDWTESPLVALYFAVAEKEHEDSDSALWTILPRNLNENSNITPELSQDIPSIEDESVMNWAPKNILSDTVPDRDPIAIIAPRNTKRMQAQLGVFTVMHKEVKRIEKVGNGDHVWKYMIPSISKSTIVQQLKLLGINEFTLFPELQSIGLLLKDEL